MGHYITVKPTPNPNPNYVPPGCHVEKKEELTKIYCVMSEDEWFDGVAPIGFFTTKEKALAYKHEAQKDKKRWNHYRLFIQEYDVDREYERIDF